MMYYLKKMPSGSRQSDSQFDDWGGEMSISRVEPRPYEVIQRKKDRNKRRELKTVPLNGPMETRNDPRIVMKVAFPKL